MPQLDFLIYSYQFTILILVFFLLYDLLLNYWLPGFLGGLFLTARLRSSQEIVLSYCLINQPHSFFNLLRKVRFLVR